MKTAIEAMIRTVVGMGTRWLFLRGLPKAFGFLARGACHKEAIGILRQWVAWSADATDEVPGPLLLKTFKFLKEHDEDVDVTAHLFAVPVSMNGKGADETPVPGEPVPTEGSSTNGG